MDETKRSLADVHARMSAHGRDPSKLDVSLFFLADEIQSEEAMAKARDSGANRVILRLPIADEASVLKVLDSYAVFVS
jgi:alkanesulfonate monooxygenase SsuD/methylene tetrahydromethanopterin reductase-like flavin-dependent oxidoreductase (luciferase family)